MGDMGYDYEISRELLEHFVEYVYEERIITQTHYEESKIAEVLKEMKQQDYNGKIKVEELK